MWSEIAMKSYIQSFYIIEIPYGSKSCLDLRRRLRLGSGSPTQNKQWKYFCNKVYNCKTWVFSKIIFKLVCIFVNTYLMVHNVVCLSFRRRHQEFLLQFHRKWEVLVAFISTIVFLVSRQKLLWIKTRGRICSRPL
jgi:hypothetical protein